MNTVLTNAAGIIGGGSTTSSNGGFYPNSL